MTHWHSLVQSVVIESQQPAGTWSYTFLSNIFKSVRKLRPNEYSKFFEALIDYIQNDDVTPLQQFKIAQLLSSTNQQNPSKADSILKQKQPEIMKFVENCNGLPLLLAAKKLLLGLYTVHVIPSKNTRYISSSTEPVNRPTENAIPKSTSVIFHS